MATQANVAGRGADGTPDSESDAKSSTVLIVGAGVVGCVTAIKLAQAKIDCTIIEKLNETSIAPRACGYFGAAQIFLNEIGMYKHIREKGFMTRGISWRGLPKDDGTGTFKQYGDLVAAQWLCDPNDYELPVGTGMLGLPQGSLNRLLVEKALETGYVHVDYGMKLSSVMENSKSTGVTALVEDVNTQSEIKYHARYCVGADGAHSALRRSLNIPFGGHTWPERILTTNVMIPNVVDPVYHSFFYMVDKFWGLASPLEEAILGKTTLWRYNFAVPADDTRSDEELLSDETILDLYETRMPGPRPLQVKIEARVLYKIHQRLVPTMRKGHCLLAGDAAHVCNPMGALGLNTGILDADALAEALIMVLKEDCSDKVLDLYSDERRQVFAFFVDPMSTQNKLRIQSNPPEVAPEQDSYFRLLNSNPTEEQMKELMKPYFETWRTAIRKVAKAAGL
ncbi:hypothetical protein H2204_009960 [Knufia peltigerae]|uniref:FAD-binding domain-containing protein n=1 Tax=Knufia peltigerae TaxID=1002370 RepID=A0AA38XX32_9EURO|nr:hypothetical protein H2204_009960 [Knufia peltigerae]